MCFPPKSPGSMQLPVTACSSPRFSPCLLPPDPSLLLSSPVRGKGPRVSVCLKHLFALELCFSGASSSSLSHSPGKERVAEFCWLVAAQLCWYGHLQGGDDRGLPSSCWLIDCTEATTSRMCRKEPLGHPDPLLWTSCLCWACWEKGKV